MKEGEVIVSVAKKYLGQREISGNRGFECEYFEQKMKAVGWQDTHAWCAYFAELVWREAYGQMNSVIEADLRRLFSASATTTYSNFLKSTDYKKYLSNSPAIGALAVWKLGSGWQGHIGIVQQFTKKEVTTIDGNTNASGGREGIEVAAMKRLISYNYREKALNLLGFIHPPKIDNHG